MYFTGFADEAAKGIDGQIKATLDLGWKYIESRNIDGENIHDISDEKFDIVCGKLADAGVEINCFGSAIANWGKKIDEPFGSSLAETKRAIPRMQRLGTKLVRIMSFAVLDGRDPADQMEQERFARVRELVKIFADTGITAVHENCMNYGGMSWEYTLKLLDNVPGLRLVYDTGNPVFTDDRSKAKPYPKQSSWEFYKNVREFISYVHIKDGIWNAEEDKAVFTFPGEGEGDAKKILDDLVKTGYDGGLSIEPHLAVVFHDKTITSDEDIMYANYVEYGKRVMKMIEDSNKQLAVSSKQ